jgi:hypothetical protein
VAGILAAGILVARMCDRPFGKIWVRGDQLLGKFGLGAIEFLSLGGGGFI